MARNKHPEETVQLILDTGKKLFLEKGYEKTSLQDIMNETKLSKGAIYHHFASKEEIFITICGRMGRENAEFLRKSRDDKTLNGHDKLKQIFHDALDSSLNHTMITMMPYLLDNPKFLALEIKDIYTETAPHYIEPILKEGIADGSIHTEYPKELAEAIMVLANVWLNPLLLPSDIEQMKNRCNVFIQMMNGIGINLPKEELTEAYVSYSKLLHEQSDNNEL